jgi:hypothetical protein
MARAEAATSPKHNERFDRGNKRTATAISARPNPLCGVAHTTVYFSLPGIYFSLPAEKTSAPRAHAGEKIWIAARPPHPPRYAWHPLPRSGRGATTHFAMLRADPGKVKRRFLRTFASELCCQKPLARAWPGHPRLDVAISATKTWVAGTSPATGMLFSCAGLRPRDNIRFPRQPCAPRERRDQVPTGPRGARPEDRLRAWWVRERRLPVSCDHFPGRDGRVADRHDHRQEARNR